MLSPGAAGVCKPTHLKSAMASSASRDVIVLGEALMDCIAQPDGSLVPLQGGSPYNMARAAALRGARVAYLNPLSTDTFGTGLGQTLLRDGVALAGGQTSKPTSLAVVQVKDGQPSYGFYREGIADRDYTVADVITQLRSMPPAVLHTGSLLLIPPESDKIVEILRAARAMGWTISVDVNLRPKVADDLPAYVRAISQVVAEADWLKASDEDLETLGYAEVGLAAAPRLVAELRASVAAQRLSHVALTFGGDGAFLDVQGSVCQRAAPRVTVKDTVGAGDTFWGNCLADWSGQPEGCAQRVAQTLTLAMAAAAINCTRQGCQPPTAAETLAFAA